MVLFKFLDRGIGLASTVVLARLLVPADFGLIAIAMMIISALTLFMAFSFDVHLIQSPDAGRPQFDTAWTFNVIFGLIVGLALSVLAYPAAALYREPRLSAVMFALAVGTVANGFSNIGPVAFRREMRFDREFRFMLAKRLAPVMVTIPVAWWLHSYWALVLGQLAGTMGAVWLSYRVSDYRPRLSMAARAELFHASKWLLVNNLLIFLNGRAAELVIGKIAGIGALGAYTISSEISTMPTTELVAPINRAAFPGYSRLAGDITELRNSFLSVIAMIALFGLPAGLGIAAVADLIVPAALGPSWTAAIPLIQVLALYGVLTALQSNIGYVYLAVGRPRLITIVALIQFVVLVGILLPATRYYGAQGAAWAFLATAIAMVPVNQALITRQLGLSVGGYLARLWRPICASAAMAALVWLFKSALPAHAGTASNVAALLSSVSFGALCYGVLLYGLWRLSGRPEGAEKVCLAGIDVALQRAGLRLRLL